MNEIEGEQITHTSNVKEILDYMMERFPESKVVITLGSDGSIYRDKDCEYFQPSYKVKVVDTTAAGDTFTGYFISSLLHKLTLPEALKLSSKAAAIAVSRAGATASIPYREEVMRADFIE
jgi:ribokinase